MKSRWHLVILAASIGCGASAAPVAVQVLGTVPAAEPTAQNVVTVAAAIFPRHAVPGQLVTLAVRLRTAD
ncbi:MAG TPA: hypothetical protein VMF30_12430, partial [Pirellulales bacterium]|nr:hypothetical protein [Pirellulales bacterium]